MMKTDSAYFGRDIARLDGREKALGRARYIDDYHFENMLHLALVRSTEAHAVIADLNLRLPDDLREKDILIFTAEHLAANVIDDVIEDQPVLATDKVRYKGEPVAIVAAGSPGLASTVASRLANQVVYEPLPAFFEPEHALAAQGGTIHENGNICAEFSHAKGDVDLAFAECAEVITETFHLPPQDHAFMEPPGTVASWQHDRLSVISSTQNVFHDRRMIARALGLCESAVTVTGSTVGGAFGGKDGHLTQIFPALVTQLAKRPAKLVLTREETFAVTFKRHPAEVTVKAGFLSDGTLHAFDAYGLLDTGAYATLGPAVLGLFSEHLPGPYRVNHCRIHAQLLYTNKAPAHAFRGFGGPQGAFATETVMTMAALALRLDPLDIRLKNALRPGDTGALGQPIGASCGIYDALKTIQASKKWQSWQVDDDPYVGFGIAGGHLSCGLGKDLPDRAEAVIADMPDGKVDVRIGLIDNGQGSTTALAQIAADALGLPLKRISMVMADTSLTRDSGSTAGSRSSYVGGQAIMAAAREYRRKKESNPDMAVTAAGAFDFPQSTFATSFIGIPHAMYTFIAQAVRLAVSPITGQVTLLDILAVTEAGAIINPMQLDGQIQGGIVMSVGYALAEKSRFSNGRYDGDFTAYVLPSAPDVPEIGCATVESYEPTGPGGAKGAAEVSTVSIAPAMNMALQQITGEFERALPFSPERILDALEQKE